MSKSPKTVRQGDERNLYLRRLKATTNAPHKHADANDRLNVKQSDNTTRPGLVGTSQRSNVPLAKNYKNKLTSPVKQKSLKSSRVTNHLYIQSLAKRLQSSSSSSLPAIDHIKVRTMKVQHQESGDTSVSHAKGLKKEIPKGKNKLDESVEREKKIENNQHDGTVASNTNGKSSSEHQTLEQEQHAENNVNKEMTKDNNVDNDKLPEIQDGKDTETNDEVVIVDEKSSNGKNEENNIIEIIADFEQTKGDVEIIEICCEIESERQSTPISKDDTSAADTKKQECLSGSDVVESTTSESPAEQPVDIEKNQDGVQAKDDDASFISYDANIMLKDVQIKLNDCLKDNSKLYDVTDPNASMSDSFKDQSFGRTLRSISGRTSLGRLRNVTVRERRMSPNDSLFVNTSRVSLSQERAAYTELADSSFHNYSRLDRKRKLETDIEPKTKKVKTDEGYNFFNFSWDYLKYWRRPEVPTSDYQLNIDEKMQKVEDNIMGIENTTESRKWCNIM